MMKGKRGSTQIIVGLALVVLGLYIFFLGGSLFVFILSQSALKVTGALILLGSVAAMLMKIRFPWWVWGLGAGLFILPIVISQFQGPSLSAVLGMVPK